MLEKRAELFQKRPKSGYFLSKTTNKFFGFAQSTR